MIDRMLGAARLSADTYEEVERDRSATGQALLIVVLVTLASFVGQMLAGEEVDVVRGLVLGVIRGVVSWALWALFTWLIGATILRTEHTEADWGQLARGTGFAQTPGLLNVITFIPAIGLLIALLTFVWTIAGMVVAVRQCLDYTSTLRAFFVILLAFIPVLILNAIVFTLTGGN
ncbi:MAG: YIP1 family protein [Chloroflexi bacterium]|nr:YIP1 family protein [Chloroflexota bacterium]MCY3939214.1 YIP1 family protein [Chloroflexota bacterium]